MSNPLAVPLVLLGALIAVLGVHLAARAPSVQSTAPALERTRQPQWFHLRDPACPPILPCKPMIVRDRDFYAKNGVDV